MTKIKLLLLTLSSRKEEHESIQIILVTIKTIIFYDHCDVIEDIEADENEGCRVCHTCLSFFGSLESRDAVFVTQVRKMHECSCTKRESCDSRGPKRDKRLA